MTNQKINVRGTEIIIFQQKEDDYISLTNIAHYKDPNSDDVVKNWMRNRNTLEFLGLWGGFATILQLTITYLN